MHCIVLSAILISSAVAAEDAQIAEKGREIFNQFCYHCHGSDAVQGERIRDLRRLSKRYGDERHDMFIKTITEGRPDKGMPSWKDSLTGEQIKQIWAFLETVQSQ